MRANNFGLPLFLNRALFCFSFLTRLLVFKSPFSHLMTALCAVSLLFDFFISL